MRPGAGIVLLLMLASGCAAPPAPEPWTDNFGAIRSAAIPQDVRAFSIRRQGCDHFRGEPGYSPERQKFLDQQIAKLCAGTDAELRRLRAMHEDNREAISALADFEACIAYDTDCTATQTED